MGKLISSLLVILQCAVALATFDAFADTGQPAVAIIIDDMGDRLLDGKRALSLPGKVTYAVIPNTAHAVEFAHFAYKQNREVILHAPMQPLKDHEPNSGVLNLRMDYNEFSAVVKSWLASVPHISGLNNHMGSLITQHTGYMSWLMQELSQQGSLYFVDSRTSPDSVAARIADEYYLPKTERDVFLDNKREAAAINIQFDRMIKIALASGSALAIGHPYPETLSVLEQRMPLLEQAGISLVNVSTIISIQQQQRKSRIWQTSLSR
ncbi:MAG: divergent polysaccharide deacetylase family protein [Gammaproteobacteria bacterium]|nr:MAG: divergent polysaccharide deacetylase family protein [Gammaproteobacteria bacterium]